MVKKGKKITDYIKLQIPAGKATPARPVGPALGQKGINIGEFCTAFNKQTANQPELLIPVVITVYEDRSFTFITKTPPVPVLIKNKLKIEKGSGEPNKKKIGKITETQIEEIAKIKLADLNCYELKSAMMLVAGTAKSMGLEVPSSY